MRSTIKKIKRISLTTVAVIGATLLLNYANYKRYYSSIFTIQTVDFNILSHVLSTKLSILLADNNKREINKVINSNYGLFGLVITDCKTDKPDCPGQQVLFSTYSKYQSYASADLNNFTFDLLRNPPPLKVEQFYPKSTAKKRESTGQQNSGNIIGRVYYIRRKFPSFLIAQWSWLKNPFSFSSVNPLYNLTFAVMAIGGVTLYLLVEKKDLQNQQKEQEYQLKLLKTENELLKFRTFNSAFEQIIEQDFSSVIANNLQQLDSLLKNILLRIESDAQNIIHDIYKAPLLFNPDTIPKYINQLEKDKGKSHISDELIELLKNLNKTIQTLKWVVEELRGITRIQSEPIIVQKQLKHFQQNLPPTIQDWQIDFVYPDTDLWINCNPWHLRSIIKNALYNSSSAMKKYRRKLKKEKKNFNGKIKVECKRKDDLVIIQIEDNGSGIPEDIIERLYETTERLNQTAGNLRGNGSIIISTYLTLHNGTVEKENLDQGARVSFIFPLIKQEA
ncbi:sensor histidine kinase [Cyanobacterium aponinum]|uniref:Histidine kinase domain-containing protein n=1 Tax=Cyanobacterium aponinum 0216 TaxID=2676140 RepID=A0A844GPM9_9CHRO|nr:HAMP domain-containing sensor histidine kinase [Cyanobacterium aponinum]MTF37523.1 hypothetical protein [Cyanobacterium aponinum 0216]